MLVCSCLRFLSIFRVLAIYRCWKPWTCIQIVHNYTIIIIIWYRVQISWRKTMHFKKIFWVGEWIVLAFDYCYWEFIENVIFLIRAKIMYTVSRPCLIILKRQFMLYCHLNFINIQDITTVFLLWMTYISWEHWLILRYIQLLYYYYIIIII